MGRITIFTVDDCTHSDRVKVVFEKMDIPFTEINLTRFPERRNDMLALADRISVPQVFFNTRCVGGADDTIQLLQRWEHDKRRYKTARERYDFEVGRQPDPFNPRLAEPERPSPVLEEFATRPRGREEYSLVLPSGRNASYVEVTETLKRILPLADNSYHLTVYRKCFLGSEGVRALMDQYEIGEEEAIAFGRYLQESRVLDHVVSQHTFDNSGYFFRLTCHQTPAVLNSYRIWTEEVDANCLRLLAGLANLVSWIETSLTDDEGKIDYKNAPQSPVFPVLEEASCELQKVVFDKMDDRTKMAFGVNVFNIMVKYAFMKVGFGVSELGRKSFFSQVKFNVGGNVFNLQEWEHGILRGNLKAPHGLTRQFSDSDARASLVVQKSDPRIHFGLNCGAKSCPPVRYLSPDHLDEELEIVAMSFCEDDDNVMVDVENREVCLSKVFLWYRADFGRDNIRMLRHILEHLRGVKRQALERLLAKENSIKVTFRGYDWSTNAKEILNFDSSVLKANVRRSVSSRKNSKS